MIQEHTVKIKAKNIAKSVQSEHLSKTGPCRHAKLLTHPLWLAVFASNGSTAFTRAFGKIG